LRDLSAATHRLPLHELLEDLTWIGDLSSSVGDKDVLGPDDEVVEILEYLVGQHPELLSSRDQDGSLPLQVSCRRGAPFTIVQSLVNHIKEASVKSVTSEGDLPLFLACEMPETSLDTIFLLMKLCPKLACCFPVVSIAMTIEEAMLQALLLVADDASKEGLPRASLDNNFSAGTRFTDPKSRRSNGYEPVRVQTYNTVRRLDTVGTGLRRTVPV
jgi:hypothetical protein